MASRITAEQLRLLAAASPSIADATCACRTLQVAAAWESVTDARWPEGMALLGTLRADDGAEPTYEEFHPAGTRYDSPQAPIAVDWFPFNRSDLYRCGACQRLFLRYTEYGGYYVDHRVRRVDATLIV